MCDKNPPIRSQFEQVMVPNYAPSEVIPVTGLGSRVWDQNNNELIDFAGGIAVSCLGHCHPKLVNALTEQGQKLWHLSNVMTNEPALTLATKLVNSTFAEKVYFANSGAEANEAALKLARRYAKDNYGEQKDEIIAFNQGFHGRTFFTVTVGGQASYSDGFGPKPQGITHLEYNNIEQLEQHISDKTCAIMLEPLQGEGGIIAASSKFLLAIRRLADKYNALVIFDEVQTGVGRTGHLYAYMGTHITPDILTSAKGLGGGFPVAAMLTTNNIAAHFKVGTHGSTYGGNPLACAVANAVLNEVNTPELLDGVRLREKLLKDGLEKINQQYSVFSEIRGKGLLIGAVLNDSYKGRSRDFLNAAVSNGLMCLVAGTNVIRFTPSLIIPVEDISQGLICFEKAVAQVTKAS